MMGNNKHRPLNLAPQPPQPVHQMTIQVFNDRQPAVSCTGDLEVALRLLTTALGSLADMLDKQRQRAQPVEDRERKLMGPRGGET